MKYLISACCFATFFGARAVLAQPPAFADVPAVDRGMQFPEPEFLAPGIKLLREEELGKNYTRSSPVQIVRNFLYGMQGRNGREKAFLVSGADWESLDNERLMAQIRTMPGRITRLFLSLPGDKEELPPVPLIDAPNGATEVTVDVVVHASDELGVNIASPETVRLRLERTAGGPVWRIVPSDKAPFDQSTPQPSGVIQTYAYYFKDAAAALNGFKARESMTQVKQLGLGVLQFLQDHNETYDMTAKNFAGKIAPYVLAAELFSAPGDDEFVQSYSFNPQLAGKNLAGIANPASVVAIYLGKEGQLDFRYGKTTVVGFADGHVERVSEERAKTLQWTP